MPKDPADNPLRSKLFWVGILYFAQGFPLGIFYDVLPVHFRQEGVELWKIGFMSLLGLAWTLKFLWAPAIDHYRHHRRWMFTVDLAMGAVMLVFAAHSGFGPWVWVAVGLFTLFSATNDIAIDGYTIEFLHKDEMGRANGLRIGFYRVGMLTAGVVLILSDWLGWAGTYLVAAGLFAAFALTCLRAPAEKAVHRPRSVRLITELRTLLAHPGALATVVLFLLGALWLVNRSTGWSGQVEGFWWYAIATGAVVVGTGVLRPPQEKALMDRPVSEGPLFGTLLGMLQRPGMAAVIAFILLFKLGDAAMGFMVKPFWVDAGFSASQIGLVSVNLGLALSIAGGIAGGWVTDRVGIYHALWTLGLAQAVSNLGYAWAATVIPVGGTAAALPSAQVALMYGASAVESFTGGLGTGAFLAFLMAIVNKQHAATEYALLSSVFALSRSLAGWAGGFGAEGMGYGPYFLLTFFLAFPAYLLLPWAKGMLAYAASRRDWDQR
jgi:PAT family beta-lactamase induction signal transducer AmpG